jgi:glyoxylase-like metal-dependent hydrolase (beta-lactamase superfamily II)
MNRLLTAFMLLLPALTAFAGVAGKAGVTVDMSPIQVGPHSYYVQGLPGAASAENQGFMSNSGFVITREGVVVFDALGTPALARKLVSEIRKLTDLPIKRVIMSHYHADHYYGLQVFKDLGAEIWAHKGAKDATRSTAAAERLAQRKEALSPWVDDSIRLVEADLWLEGDTDFKMGGLTFAIRHVGPAHSAEDLAMFVREDGVLYAGDLVFEGRIPFVGEADSRAWLASLDELLAFNARVLVPGHGAASEDPDRDLALTRDYLTYLRTQMGKAVDELVPFAEAYRATDWSQYEKLPAFEEANRINAYQTYLLLERETFHE